MKAIWNGAIGFGLVNIPVKIYSATETTKLDLDMLDKSDFSNIRFKQGKRKYGERSKMGKYRQRLSHGRQIYCS